MTRCLWGEGSRQRWSVMCEKHVFFVAVEQNERSQSLVWVSTPQRGKPVLNSVFRSHNCWPKADQPRSRKQNRIFQHFRRLFLPGTLKNVPCCLNEQLSIFQRNLLIVELADFAGSKDGQLAQVRFFIETGWITQNKPTVSYNSPSFDVLSKLGQLAIRWNSSLQNRPIPLQ